jgi:hypothetical protein
MRCVDDLSTALMRAIDERGVAQTEICIRAGQGGTQLRQVMNAEDFSVSTLLGFADALALDVVLVPRQGTVGPNGELLSEAPVKTLLEIAHERVRPRTPWQG